jgi:hypothetical protein
MSETKEVNVLSGKTLVRVSEFLAKITVTQKGNNFRVNMPLDIWDKWSEEEKKEFLAYACFYWFMNQLKDSGDSPSYVQ